MQGVDVWTDAEPTVRRLQALACIGWSSKKIAAQLVGFTGSTVALIREGHQAEVRQSTARQVSALYTRLAMTPNTAMGSNQTRGWARKHGWRGPLHWASIEEGIADE